MLAKSCEKREMSVFKCVVKLVIQLPSFHNDESTDSGAICGRK